MTRVAIVIQAGAALHHAHSAVDCRALGAVVADPQDLADLALVAEASRKASLL